jgi:hypothetical protein
VESTALAALLLPPMLLLLLLLLHNERGAAAVAAAALAAIRAPQPQTAARPSREKPHMIEDSARIPKTCSSSVLRCTLGKV